jgi:hypothetical protein
MHESRALVIYSSVDVSPSQKLVDETLVLPRYWTYPGTQLSGLGSYFLFCFFPRATTRAKIAVEIAIISAHAQSHEFSNKLAPANFE